MFDQRRHVLQLSSGDECGPHTLYTAKYTNVNSIWMHFSEVGLAYTYALYECFPRNKLFDSFCCRTYFAAGIVREVHAELARPFELKGLSFQKRLENNVRKVNSRNNASYTTKRCSQLNICRASLVLRYRLKAGCIWSKILRNACIFSVGWSIMNFSCRLCSLSTLKSTTRRHVTRYKCTTEASAESSWTSNDESLEVRSYHQRFRMTAPDSEWSTSLILHDFVTYTIITTG